ncbi:MAG: iron-sulfur cluster assembly protein [Chloroflexota bacterium]|jgi:metal-sulfur cluster biosynthetic enzyme|nr:iron-sulfur cluster assembly protein [Chloroflexota bacterium]MDP6758126.1 iron-sulfur cluster assembly protein [Chloroflexota bacterium]|tara:strand:- start:142 stop:441 length:300 start_codon:yes stop_codon:yes gene_type:complete
MTTKDDVIAALETVVDPELNLDIWNLGLIYNVEVDESTVNIDLTLTTPMCPVGPMIVSNTKEAVEKVDGVELANIEMVWDPPWDMEMMSEDLRFMLGRI